MRMRALLEARRIHCTPQTIISVTKPFFTIVHIAQTTENACRLILLRLTITLVVFRGGLCIGLWLLRRSLPRRTACNSLHESSLIRQVTTFCGIDRTLLALIQLWCRLSHAVSELKQHRRPFLGHILTAEVRRLIAIQ